MKYKIHYKSLDDNKKQIIDKINNFYKDKYQFENLFEDTEPIVFRWKEFMPGFGTNASDHILSVHFGDYVIYQVKDSEYEPFSNKELKFFDKLGFELDSDFSNSMDQDITDWTNE